MLLVEDAQRNYFRNIKSFKTGDRPKQLDVRSVFPVSKDGEVEKLAEFFNKISQEFDP